MLWWRDGLAHAMGSHCNMAIQKVAKLQCSSVASLCAAANELSAEPLAGWSSLDLIQLVEQLGGGPFYNKHKAYKAGITRLYIARALCAHLLRSAWVNRRLDFTHLEEGPMTLECTNEQTSADISAMLLLPLGLILVDYVTLQEADPAEEASAGEVPQVWRDDHVFRQISYLKSAVAVLHHCVPDGLMSTWGRVPRPVLLEAYVIGLEGLSALASHSPPEVVLLEAAQKSLLGQHPFKETVSSADVLPETIPPAPGAASSVTPPTSSEPTISHTQAPFMMKDKNHTMAINFDGPFSGMRKGDKANIKGLSDSLCTALDASFSNIAEFVQLSFSEVGEALREWQSKRQKVVDQFGSHNHESGFSRALGHRADLSLLARLFGELRPHAAR